MQRFCKIDSVVHIHMQMFYLYHIHILYHKLTDKLYLYGKFHMVHEMLYYACVVNTVNDKSFEGEKFRGLLGSSGMRGKVSRFFPSPPS